MVNPTYYFSYWTSYLKIFISLAIVVDKLFTASIKELTHIHEFEKLKSFVYCFM